MIRMSFKSALRHKEEAFIKFKQTFGHRYESQTYHLLDFDRFCLDEFPDSDKLTEEMVMKWAVIKQTENSNGYISRISVVRQFGKYLSMLGEDAFILPDGLKGGDMPLIPYVFTPESLRNFWNYTDSMERYYQSTVRHLVAPIMFSDRNNPFHWIAWLSQTWSVSISQGFPPEAVRSTLYLWRRSR